MTNSISYFPDQIDGMTADECKTLNRLIDVWRKKLVNNSKRTNYYEMKNKLEDLQISIPPQLVDIDTVVGWPAKAVDYLSARSIFDGYVFENDEELAKQVNRILRDNKFKSLYSQSVTSELIHSVSFFTISKGCKKEPDVLVSAYSAEEAAAEWDYRLKRIKDGFTIIDSDEYGDVTHVNLYTDDAVIEVRKGENDVWNATRLAHPQGRPLMYAMVHKPSLKRPFGKSRINRAVMSITNSAVRTALRTEVASEFFTSPQKYLLGADKTIFEDKSKWDAYIGAIMAISRDEEGQVPQFGQLSQMSMQPHIDYMRNLASMFAGETSIPVSSLGVIHDNPSSAEAIYAAKEDLIIETNALNDINGDELREMGMMIVAISQEKTVDKLTDEERSIMPMFKNPAMPSIVSQSDAMVKQAAAAPWIAETDVFLEELGYSEDQRMRMLADKRDAESTAIVAAMKSKVETASTIAGTASPAPPPAVDTMGSENGGDDE